MYRTAPEGVSFDPLLVVPGVGLRDVLVGGATPQRVLAVFGADAQIHRYGTDGNISKISYEYTKDGDYEPRRPGAASCPSYFLFDFGLLTAINVGVYQSELYTTGGIRTGSSKQDVLSVFGSHGEILEGDDFETHRYIGVGIDLVLIKRDYTVSSFLVFREQRTRA